MQKSWDHWNKIYSNSEGSLQFLILNAFLTCSCRLLRSNTIVGVRNLKVKKQYFLPSLIPYVFQGCKEYETFNLKQLDSNLICPTKCQTVCRFCPVYAYKQGCSSVSRSSVKGFSGLGIRSSMLYRIEYWMCCGSSMKSFSWRTI